MSTVCTGWGLETRLTGIKTATNWIRISPSSTHAQWHVPRLTFSSSFHPPPVSCAALETTHLTCPEQYKVISQTHKASDRTISKLQDHVFQLKLTNYDVHLHGQGNYNKSCRGSDQCTSVSTYNYKLITQWILSTVTMLFTDFPCALQEQLT